jgi:hypothetical protein
VSQKIRQVRNVLAMDATEAVDGLMERYMRLFKQHPLLMHAIVIPLTVGLFAALWFMAGRTYFLVVATITVLWGLVVGIGAWVKRRKLDRKPA